MTRHFLTASHLECYGNVEANTKDDMGAEIKHQNDAPSISITYAPSCVALSCCLHNVVAEDRPPVGLPFSSRCQSQIILADIDQVGQPVRKTRHVGQSADPHTGISLLQGRFLVVGRSSPYKSIFPP